MTRTARIASIGLGCAGLLLATAAPAIAEPATANGGPARAVAVSSNLVNGKPVTAAAAAGSGELAEALAVSDCQNRGGEKCQALWVGGNRCVVVISDGNNLGAGSGTSIAAARTAALAKWTNVDKSASVIVSACP